QDIPVTGNSALAGLAGKVTGMSVVSAGGRPGTAPSIMLRGPKSINSSASRTPLILVDGVILNGSSNDINPDDIESVEVVKGAAASSLYGSRAGNGVIQITTKSAKNSLEGVTFHFRNEAGASDVERDFGLAKYHALVMDETNRQFCAAVSGQPLCARTFDYFFEQSRIN